MKYAVETGSVTMIYLPSFIKFSSAIQKLIEGGVHKHTAWLSHKPTFIFSK
jgi:hypothetical protein